MKLTNEIQKICELGKLVNNYILLILAKPFIFNFFFLYIATIHSLILLFRLNDTTMKKFAYVLIIIAATCIFLSSCNRKGNCPAYRSHVDQEQVINPRG